jgi:hypothetical protein
MLPTIRQLRGELCTHAASGPKPLPPCSPVGWSRFRAVLMLQGFYRPAIRANNGTLVMDGNVEGIFGVELLKLADVRNCR